ncbi:MAG: hypothetical protein ACOC46_00270 [Pirellulales bacterium]
MPSEMQFDRPGRGSRAVLALAVALAGVYYAVLALVVCPPRAFWSGDAGMKFVQLESLRRGDCTTLALAYPGAELDPSGEHWPFPPPFAVWRDSAWYSTFSPFFPALSVPLYAALSFTGLYVLPLAAGIGLVCCAVVLTARLGYGARERIAAVLIVAFGSPVAFYSATFWEHTPAALLCFISVSVVAARLARRPAGLVAAPRGEAPAPAESIVRIAVWLAAAGVVGGTAVALRHEALLFVAAVALAWFLCAGRNGRRAIPAAAYLAGAAVPVAGIALLNVRWFGDVLGLLPAHFTERPTDGSLLAWAETQCRVGREMLLDPTGGLLPVVPVVVLGLVPIVRPGRCSPAVRFLSWTGLLFLAVCLLSAPNAGGKQFGPRYLLLCVSPLLVAAAGAMAGSLRRAPLGTTTGGTTAPMRRGVWVAGVLVIVLGLASITRSFEGAYRLWREKARYEAPMLAFARAAPADVILASHPYFPQQAASLYFQKRIFRVSPSLRDADVLPAALRAGIDTVLYVDHPAFPRVESLIWPVPSGGWIDVDVGPPTVIAHYRLQLWRLSRPVTDGR